MVEILINLFNKAGPEIVSIILIMAIVWSAVWKGIGLWKSARNKKLGWFIAILILNTLGILPILYIYIFSKKKKKKQDK